MSAEWLHEGGPVAVISGRYSNVTLHTVVKLTKRDVVIETGDRFNRERLAKSGATGWDGRWTLHDPSDPVIVAKLAHQRRSRIRSRAYRLVDPLLLRWYRDGDDEAGAEACRVLDAALRVIAEDK